MTDTTPDLFEQALNVPAPVTLAAVVMLAERAVRDAIARRGAGDLGASIHVAGHAAALAGEVLRAMGDRPPAALVPILPRAQHAYCVAGYLSNEGRGDAERFAACVRTHAAAAYGVPAASVHVERTAAMWEAGHPGFAPVQLDG